MGPPKRDRCYDPVHHVLKDKDTVTVVEVVVVVVTK